MFTSNWYLKMVRLSTKQCPGSETGQLKVLYISDNHNFIVERVNV